MFHFRFVYHKKGNSNYELTLMDGIKAGMGQFWILSVGGEIEPMPINEYIPTDGVTVLFQLVTTMGDSSGTVAVQTYPRGIFGFIQW